MRLLLDTHALIWWWTDDTHLPDNMRALISDIDNHVFASAASAWEIATKQRLGKLGLPHLDTRCYTHLLTADGFEPLPITTPHALLAGSYPQPHRDPFDRMLAAQAELDGLPLITKDPALRQFDIELLW